MGSDFYSPQQAARILSRSGKAITERRVRQMLQAGELSGERLPSGRWQVEQSAVLEMLEDRRRENSPGNDPMTVDDRETGEIAPDSPQMSLSSSESVRELLSRVEALSRELGRSEARLELTERTESSIREERDQLREDLEAEREERRRLQERLDQLQDSPQTLQNPPESTASGFEGYGSGSAPEEPEKAIQELPGTPRFQSVRRIAARILGR